MATSEIRKKTSRETRSYWVADCAKCGIEFEVYPLDLDPEKMCPSCQRRTAMDEALAALRWMIDAKVLEVKSAGGDADELEFVRLQAEDGRIFDLTAGGWEERYIEWEVAE